MSVDEHFWWYLSRASGMVAWITLAATCLWGILLITRMLKPADRPAWLLDLHRWLGAVTVVTVFVHVLVLLGDGYMKPTLAQLFVPFATGWAHESLAANRLAYAFGIVALYLLLIVEISSLLIKKLPRKVWSTIHLSSYIVFVLSTVHGVMAGSDAANIVFICTLVAVAAILAFSFTARVLQGRAKRLSRAALSPR